MRCAAVANIVQPVVLHFFEAIHSARKPVTLFFSASVVVLSFLAPLPPQLLVCYFVSGANHDTRSRSSATGVITTLRRRLCLYCTLLHYYTH